MASGASSGDDHGPTAEEVKSFKDKLEEMYKPTVNAAGYSPAPSRQQAELRDKDVMMQRMQQGIAPEGAVLHGLAAAASLQDAVMASHSGRGQVGVWCERCNSRLVELKKQALRLMIMHPGLIRLAMKDSSALYERLQIPKSLYEAWNGSQCEVCSTQLKQLKQEAVAMVQSLEEAQSQSEAASLSNLPALVGSRDLASLQRYLYTQHSHGNGSGHSRSSRQGKSALPAASRLPPSVPVAIQAQQYLEESLGSKWRGNQKSGSVLTQCQVQTSYGASANGKGTVSEMSVAGRPAIPQNLPQSLSYLQHHQQMQQQQQLMQQQQMMQHQHQQQQHHLQQQQQQQQADRLAAATAGMRPPFNPAVLRSGTGPPMPVGANIAGTSAAASFFARAAQKLNLSSKKRKQQQQLQQQQLRQPVFVPDPHTREPEPPLFPTNFSQVIAKSPPSAPPSLLRNVARVKDNPGVGKVKVMLRVVPSGNPTDNATFVTVDTKKKQVTLFDPTFLSGFITPANRRAGVAAPKMFAFDAIFPQDASQAEVCSGSVSDIVSSVVNGADGCLFCYGHSHLGKTYTMVGSDKSTHTLGIIPCAIAWLFKLINEKKERTSTRFSVRVSAVEVYGKQENLRDLLVEQANGSNNGCGTSPALYLQEDPICGIQLLNQNELRAPTAEKAAFYLDAAVAARMNKASKEDSEDSKYSHMLFTLHVYQYRIDKSGKGGVIGGRSRLHLIDLGSGDKSGGKIVNGVALSYSALGQVILALLNNQKHIPNKDSKLTRILREAMGSLSCRTVMIAHVSSAIQSYSETLNTIQLSSRIHRMRKKKSKYSGTSSSGGESSCEEGRIRRHVRPLHSRHQSSGMQVTNALNQSEPEYLSSSEQSCDTVIYCGPDGCALSDRELTDNEGPPSHVPLWKPPILESDEEEVDEVPSVAKDLQTFNKSMTDPIYEVIEPEGSSQFQKDACQPASLQQPSGGPSTPAQAPSSRIPVASSPATQIGVVSPFKKSGLPLPTRRLAPKSEQPSSPIEKATAARGTCTEAGPFMSPSSKDDQSASMKANVSVSPAETCQSEEKSQPSVSPKPKVPPRRTPGLSKVMTGEALLEEEDVTLEGLPTVLESQEDEADGKGTPEERASSVDLTTAVLDQVQCLQWEEDVERETEGESVNQEGKTQKISKEEERRLKAGMDQHKDLPPILPPKLFLNCSTSKVPPPPPKPQINKPVQPCLESDDDDELSELRNMDKSLCSQLRAVEPETPGSDSLKDGDFLEGISQKRMSVRERLMLMHSNLGSTDSDAILRCLGSIDNLSDMLEKPISEVSEDDLSIAFSEQDTMSFVSQDTSGAVSFDDNMTLDDLPMGSEAICCIKELEQRSIDSFSENFSLSLNEASVNGCVNEPYLLLGMEDRANLSVGNIGHYVYSDDESEIVETGGERHVRRRRRSEHHSEQEAFDSVSLASHDLEAIKSMYVISSLNLEDISLLDEDLLEGSEITMPEMKLQEGYMEEEATVVTYMTINDEQVVMREKHLAIDHPLRRLSCISDATDATFSTTSRPASFMEQDDDNTIVDENEESTLDNSSSSQWLPKNESSPGLRDANRNWNCSSGRVAGTQAFNLNHQVKGFVDGVQLRTNPEKGAMCLPHLTPNGNQTRPDLRAESPVWQRMDGVVPDQQLSKNGEVLPIPTNGSNNRTFFNLADKKDSQLSQSATSTPIQTPQRSTQNKGVSVIKLVEIESKGVHTSPIHKCCDPAPSEATSISGKINPTPASKSESSSKYDSPQHHARNSSRLRSLSHQPSPLVLSAAISRAKEEMEYRHHRNNSRDFDQSSRDILLLRRPDGADAKEVDSDCHFNYIASKIQQYELSEETKELAEILSTSSSERPPAIGACSSPAFEVEVNPCFSQELDDALIKDAVNPDLPVLDDKPDKESVDEIITCRQCPVSEQDNEGSVAAPQAPCKPNRGLVKPKTNSSHLPQSETEIQHKNSKNFAAKTSDSSRIPVPPAKSSSKPENRSLKGSSIPTKIDRGSKLPIRSTSLTSVNSQKNVQNIKSSKSKASSGLSKSSRSDDSGSTTSKSSSVSSRKTVPLTSKIPQSGNSKASPPGSKAGQKASSQVASSNLPVRNKSLSKSAPSLSKSTAAGTTAPTSKIPTSTGTTGEQALLRNVNNSMAQLQPGNRLTNSSDGSNDSGIASSENVPTPSKRTILSPYSTVTKPRILRGSSSGHGSDNSSTLSDCQASNNATKCRVGGGASSGYESMLRDSEATASGSSCHDSMSECSSGRLKSSKLPKKKFPGSRRSRSAPPRSATDSHQAKNNRWKDLPPRPKCHEDGVEIKVYEVDDVQKLPQQRPDTVKCTFWKRWSPAHPNSLRPWRKRQPSWKSD
ncbi:kinesin-like protein KIF26B isoform X4 [Acanthaster planci]|uniref:Kinesin-like protein KIF26B isoform X4 n=1 Tax=Acanthaster planci TaxID=133434 RepID=A0A8B7YJV2_ACAPL|nr:kinesin-like protein KIF26B isoform X4 [Acanthaster planci]